MIAAGSKKDTKEAANLDQSSTPIDTRSVTRAAARAARRTWASSTGTRAADSGPTPLISGTSRSRRPAVSASCGRWSRSRSQSTGSD